VEEGQSAVYAYAVLLPGSRSVLLPATVRHLQERPTIRRGLGGDDNYK
jgi:hypothetical protein